MNPSKHYRSLWLIGILLMLAALACNAPGISTPTQVPPAPAPPQIIEASPTAPQVAQASPTSAPSTAATATPAPDVSGPGGCTLNAAYVADVTIPDNTELAPGRAFTKTWRVRNSGTCAWEAGTQLVFTSGELMGGPAAVNVPSVAPGSSTDISVNLSAPAAPGTYRSTWQLQGSAGTRFGSQVYVQIVVPGPATATPSPTATLTPAAPPDLIITDLKVDTSAPRQGLPLHIIATLRNQGATTAQNFHWAWRVCIHEGCAYTEAPGAFTLEPGEAIVAQMEYLFQGWATYTTEAWVDSRTQTAESNETNNTRQLVIEVEPGLPDLVITAIDFDPDPPTQGQNATIRVKVHNQGSQPTGAFTVEWWASVNAPAPACQWAVSGGLEADAKVKLECTYAYPSWYSNITTRAIADTSGTIAELSETNNTMDRETPVKQP